MFLSSSSPTLIERLEYVFNALMDAVLKRRFAGCAVLAVVGVPLFVRIQRLRNRVLRMVRRIEAGTFREWVRRQAAAPREMDPKVRQRLAGVSKLWKGVPRGRGWLLPLLPCEAALRGHQFEMILREPEMRRLLAECPRLGRMLRPFCRMLAVDAALLAVTPEDVLADEAKAAAAAAAPVVVPEVVVVQEDVGRQFVPFWQRLYDR